MAVEPNRAGGSTRRDQLVQAAQQRIVVERPLDSLVDRRLEAGHDGERRSRRAIDLAHPAVDVGAVEATVEGDHLAVEAVQRPQPEVAVLGQLGEA